jgi:hypothetical protein
MLRNVEVVPMQKVSELITFMSFWLALPKYNAI